MSYPDVNNSNIEDLNVGTLENLSLMYTRELTIEDLHILKSYESLVDGLALFIGEHCEVVLHALSHLDSSAIRIANGANTGREVGSPITDLALKMLQNIKNSKDNFSQPYFTRSKNGQLMKSITMAIPNPNGDIIGLICINMNLEAPFSDVIRTLLPNDLKAETTSPVNFASDVDELVDQTVEQSVSEIALDPSIPNNMKNKRIVIDLYERGIFDIKDAINRVAERLNISKHTVYLYIRQCRTDDEPS